MILALEQGRTMAQVKRLAAWVLVAAIVGILALVSTVGAIWPD